MLRLLVFFSFLRILYIAYCSNKMRLRVKVRRENVEEKPVERTIAQQAAKGFLINRTIQRELTTVTFIMIARCEGLLGYLALYISHIKLTNLE